MIANLDDPNSLPEIDRSELSASILAQAIEARGALIVRNCLPREVARNLDQHVLRALDEMEKPDAQRNKQWFDVQRGGGELQMARATAANAGCALLLDCPEALAHTMQAYATHGLTGILSAHLGGELMVSRHKATLRRTRPKQNLTDYWHQDGAFMGTSMRTLNVWMALTDCGERASSVEIAARRFNSVIPCEHGVALAPDKAKEAAPITVTPVCAPGDAIMFDHLCLHRTDQSPAYSEDRRALEVWFFEPSSFPHTYDQKPIRVADVLKAASV